jgi:hypothetical protein
MPVTPQTGIWDVAVSMSVDGTGNYVNTWSVRASWGEDPEDVAQECATAYSTATSFPAIQSDQLTYDTISVRKRDAVSAGIVYGSDKFDSAAGLATDPILAPQVCLLIKKGSETGGRIGRGRLYIPGVTGLTSSPSHTGLDSTDLAAATACAAEFLSQLQGGSFIHGMTLPNGNSSDPIDVSMLTVRSYWGTQRRRARQYA